MTVKELIDELMKVEDKSKPVKVYVGRDTEEGEEIDVNEIEVYPYDVTLYEY